MCNIKEENMDHFMSCEKYERTNIAWEDIYKNMTDKQFEIGREVKIRLGIREKKLLEDGQSSSLAPTAPSQM